jgi:hypothetical protein
VRATPNSDTSESSPDNNEAPPLVGEPLGPLPAPLNFHEDNGTIVQPSAALAVVASQPRSTPPPVSQQSQRPQLGATPPAAHANQNVQAWQPPPLQGQQADDDNVQDAAQPQAAPARRMITIPGILREHSDGLAELPIPAWSYSRTRTFFFSQSDLQIVKACVHNGAASLTASCRMGTVELTASRGSAAELRGRSLVD